MTLPIELQGWGEMLVRGLKNIWRASRAICITHPNINPPPSSLPNFSQIHPSVVAKIPSFFSQNKRNILEVFGFVGVIENKLIDCHVEIYRYSTHPKTHCYRRQRFSYKVFQLIYLHSLRTKGTYEHPPNPPTLFGWPSQLLLCVTIQVSYLHGERIFLFFPTLMSWYHFKDIKMIKSANWQWKT